jgi:Zn-dependent M28 family amino/carboxypeptidase
MVGRMKDNRVTAGAVDSAQEFPALISRAAGELDIKMRPGGSSTDHVSFFEKGIPAVHFTTGSHPDYHRPSDTWDKLNIQGMAKVSDLIVALGRELAAAKDGLTFKRPSSKDS